MEWNFHGKRVLVAEDNCFVAGELAERLAEANAIVVGPCASLADARQQARHSDLAVLDVDLRGEMVFPLADMLMALEVPFVFFTGYTRMQLPRRFDTIDCVLKSASPEQALRQLALRARAMEGLTVAELVPILRLEARKLINDRAAADRLVELTLELAIADPGPMPQRGEVGAWLVRIMHRQVIQDGLGRFMN